MNKKVFFTSGSGRSGTTTIVHFFNENIADCIAEHEAAPPEPRNKLHKVYQLLTGTFMDPFEDKGFRRALQWYDQDDPRLQKVINRRVTRIQNMPGAVYLEANHSFLQSLCDGLVEKIPELQVIHLIRNPVEVARSFANRPTVYEHWHVMPNFRKNCLRMESAILTDFQRHLWAWIEVELRFARFIQKYPQVRFYELEINQLNDAVEMQKMLDFFHLQTKTGELCVVEAKNKNAVSTVVNPRDYHEAQQLLRDIPLETLALLRNPYMLFDIRAGE
jgi:hypothetical protein